MFCTAHIGARHLIERGANMFPAWLRDDGLSASMAGRIAASPKPVTRRPYATSNAWVRPSKTYSTTSSSSSTTLPIARPTPEPSVWSGRASPFRAGPTAAATGRRTSLPRQPRGAGSWPPCSTPTPPSPASPRHRCAPRSPP